ncbi:MAG: hypothetical protein AAGB46_17020, partial [Verrucomicrobiota bacterium]
DVSLFQFTAQTVSEHSEWQTTSSVAYGTYEIDYQPVSFDFLGSPVQRDEENRAIQVNTRRDISDNRTLILGIGAYDGFTNFRSLWLDEYYRQQFSENTEVLGDDYVFASPGGYNATAGYRWAYRPASAFAEVSISRVQDSVSPGYEIDFDGLTRGELEIATTSLSLSSENILTPRIRSLATLRVSETSGRDTRFAFEYALNAAFGDNIIMRALGGAAKEDPEFNTQYGEVALEYSLSETLSLYLDSRYYTDTGEIEDAFLFSTAAPGLNSRKAGIGARWSGEKWSARIYYAQTNSNYKDSGSNIEFFEFLYSDRDWDHIQLAFSRGY